MKIGDQVRLKKRPKGYDKTAPVVGLTESFALVEIRPGTIAPIALTKLEIVP